MNKKIGIIWLHNDLRLHDNKLFSDAAKQVDELVVLYATYDFPSHRGQSYYYNDISDNRKQFLDESLRDLSHGLKTFGQELLLLKDASQNQLIDCMKSHEITDVFCSQTADFDHNLRQDWLAKKLPDVRFHISCNTVLFDRLPILKLPKMFSDFRRHVEKNDYLLRKNAPIAIAEFPSKLPAPPKNMNRSLVYQATMPKPRRGSFIGGETQALLHLESYFSSDAPRNYKETRNALDEWSSSTKFSAHLANGSLSVKTLLARLRQYEKDITENESTYWIWFELLWREYFYWYAHEHQQKLFTFKGITPCKRMSCFYGERFERWKKGNTPYPIVNACMNQLRETGYLSNRGRQLVTSCFIHELGMDWRYGAIYFEQQLIDYDVASNWGNWQYIAGVGADPRGGRQFNLMKQTEKYDPNGQFIAKWHGQTSDTNIDSVDAADWPIG